MIRLLSICALAASLCACDASRVSSLGPDRLRIGEYPAPACTVLEAEALAVETAAIETLRRGFDGFFITARENYSSQPGWRSSATQSHRAVGRAGAVVALEIRLIKDANPAGAGAYDARQMLGDDWEARVAAGPPAECPG